MKLVLPTDAITLGAVRRDEPIAFDIDALLGADAVFGTRASSALAFECVLARKAFAAAVGEPDPHPEWAREELVDLLDGVYRRFHLSSGSKASRELVRQLESAAASQARGRAS